MLWYKEGLLERIDKDCLPSFYGGSCECPGGCLFSNAGPWKKEEKEEELSEDIIKGRKEMTEYMFNWKKINNNKDKV